MSHHEKKKPEPQVDKKSVEQQEEEEIKRASLKNPGTPCGKPGERFTR